jgi:predicted nucleotidyltransferase
MKVIGIVAEYNPFHNGHRYLIESARKKYPGAAVVCVMSGHFLQRGEPALINKWSRAEMAVHGGVDLVLELPLVFSARSAYYFARASLILLSKTGLVTHLAFGSESGSQQELEIIARLLVNEPTEFRQLLKSYLQQGGSFASARALALQSFLDKDTEHILSQPNNILALAYLRVLEELQLAIEPIIVERQGHFHSADLNHFASATAIRQSLIQGADVADLRDVLPLSSHLIMEREIQRGAGPVFQHYLAPFILYRLRTMPLHELRQINEVTEGLEYRLKKASLHCGTWDELRHAIKSKRYSMTKINRLLLYVLFNIQARQMESFDQTGPLYYHVLAFSDQGQYLLQQMQRWSTLPVLSRGSQVKEAFDGKLGSSVRDMMSLDVMATDFYNLLLPDPSLRSARLDFTTSPLRIDSPTDG